MDMSCLFPRKNLTAYRRMATKAGKVWRETALWNSLNAWATISKPKWLASFPGTIKLKPGETVVFSWIVFKSRPRIAMP